MVTIKAVAKEAGVSVGTVSNVINNIQVKASTKEKVEAAIKKLNYEPNIYARGFKINKTNTIALILPTIWNPFFSELAYNIEKNIKKLGMKMILCNSDKDSKSEIEYIKEVFKLSDGEAYFLTTCARGEGLLKVGEDTAIIAIKPTKKEFEFVETNLNKLRKEEE